MTHPEMEEKMALSAAGLLDAAGERELLEHVRGCAECGAALERFGDLAQGLRELPPPRAPESLAIRTRVRMAAEWAAQPARPSNTAGVIVGTVIAWGVALATWAVVRLLSRGAWDLLHPELSGIAIWLAATTVVAWMTAGCAAALLGHKRRLERSSR